MIAPSSILKGAALAGLVVGAVLLARRFTPAGAVGAVGDVIASGAATVAQALNPANPDNLAARAANGVVAGLTGDEAQTVGGWVFDTFNPRAGLASNEVAGTRGTFTTDAGKYAAVMQPDALARSNSYARSLAASMAG